MTTNNNTVNTNNSAKEVSKNALAAIYLFILNEIKNSVDGLNEFDPDDYDEDDLISGHEYYDKEFEFYDEPMDEEDNSYYIDGTYDIDAERYLRYYPAEYGQSAYFEVGRVKSVKVYLYIKRIINDEENIAIPQSQVDEICTMLKNALQSYKCTVHIN